MTFYFTLSFINTVGNSEMVTIRVKIDLNSPAFNSVAAIPLLPSLNVSGLSDIATTSCFIRFEAEVNDQGDGDIDSVTVDLSYLGGPTNFDIARVNAARKPAS